MKGVVRVADKINFIGKVSSFAILGDPGCDGLGVEIMTTLPNHSRDISVKTY